MFWTLPYWSRIASTGQTGPQAPQSMQSSGQMMCKPLRSPVIASVGQRFTQAVQPMHVSMMRKAMNGPLYRQTVEHPIHHHAGHGDVRPHRERPDRDPAMVGETPADGGQPHGAQDERQSEDGEQRVGPEQHQIKGAERSLVVVDAGERETRDLSGEEERRGGEGGRH